MPTYSKTEQSEALASLREWLKPGDTVYTILEHVSSSGMSRAIRFVIPSVDGQTPCDCHSYGPQAPHFVGTPKVSFLHPNHAIGAVLGLRFHTRRGSRTDALVVHGCGMDMGFHCVESLSYALFRETGYQCLGKGKCPSNYHVNHRATVPCEGTLVYNPDGPNAGQRCYAPGGFFGRRSDIPENWPRRIVDIGDGHTVDGGPLYCITDDDGDNPRACPTCNGEGRLPNPDGPERFDLIHHDGYALRHQWL